MVINFLEVNMSKYYSIIIFTFLLIFTHSINFAQSKSRKSVSGSATKIGNNTYFNYDDCTSGTKTTIGNYDYYNYSDGSSATKTTIGNYDYYNYSNGTSATKTTIGDYDYYNSSNGTSGTGTKIGDRKSTRLNSSHANI